jgi:hypothetical protein
MGQIFKLFMVDKKPYFTIDEEVKIGDMAIVTVGDMYPSVIECKNDEQINVIQKPKTSSTKRYKVIMKPEEVKLEQSIIESLSLNDLPVMVEFENGEINILE